jgi:hypothetical protein
MNRDKIAVVARRTRFEPTTTNVLAVNPTSPTVLQGLMQMVASQGQKMDTLERKVDALATRPPQEVTVPSAQPAPKSPTETTALAKAPESKVNRSKLLQFFD